MLPRPRSLLFFLSAISPVICTADCSPLTRRIMRHSAHIIRALAHIHTHTQQYYMASYLHYISEHILYIYCIFNDVPFVPIKYLYKGSETRNACILLGTCISLFFVFQCLSYTYNTSFAICNSLSAIVNLIISTRSDITQNNLPCD